MTEVASGRAIEGAILDLDGTVYLGDRLIPGVADAIERIRNNGVDVLFLSNKAIERRRSYSEKLSNLGISATEADVINSASITATYLADHHPDDDVLVIGEEPLREELREHDLHLTDDPDETDVLLASMDRNFDYESLTAALYAMDGDTTFLATNPDRTCPTADGEIPDCAAMVGAVEAMTDEELDRVLGKPSQTAIDTAVERLAISPERGCIVGDRLETDILMGNRAGMTTVLVLSGVTDRDALRNSDIEPDYVIDSLADIGTVLPA